MLHVHGESDVLHVHDGSDECAPDSGRDYNHQQLKKQNKTKKKLDSFFSSFLFCGYVWVSV